MRESLKKLQKSCLQVPDLVIYYNQQRETKGFPEPREVKMLNKNQVSNLITFYYEKFDEIKKYGSISELYEFEYNFSSFLECIDCSPVFEEYHLVNIREW